MSWRAGPWWAGRVGAAAGFRAVAARAAAVGAAEVRSRWLAAGGAGRPGREDAAPQPVANPLAETNSTRTARILARSVMVNRMPHPGPLDAAGTAMRSRGVEPEWGPIRRVGNLYLKVTRA